MVYDDPFAAYRLPYYYDEIKRASAKFGLTTFADHWQEAVLTFVVYQGIYLASSVLSPIICPPYRKLTARNKVNFDIHVVSMINCLVMMGLSWPLFKDPILSADTIYGYTPFAGFVGAYSMGYFTWDTLVCLQHVKMFGPEFLIHGSVAAFVFIQGFRPYILYYAPIFLMFEASTPFVNVHWFSSHLPEGSIPEIVKIVNGLLLMLVFFCARILWGWYWAILFAFDTLGDKSGKVSMFIPWSIFLCNMALNVLNVYWFSKMVDALLKKIRASKKEKTL